MRKDDRINPVFLIFYIILGFILLDLLVQGVGILLFDDRVPKEQTLNYQLEQMLSIVADKMRETGELPKDLDDVAFANKFLQELYDTDYKYGYIRWYIQGDKLVIEHSGNPAKNIDRKRREMKLPPDPRTVSLSPAQE